MSGRLADALAAAGIALRKLTPGTHRAPCPSCGRSPRDDTLAVTIRHPGDVVWHCHRQCGFTGGWREREEMPRRPAPERQRVAEPRPASPGLAPRWREFWASCSLITADCPAGRYLANRRCALPASDHLRWHPRTWHPAERRELPAMVGLITDVITAEPISLHFTFLAEGGAGKAPIARPRLYLAGHRKAGGVVRLWPDEEVTLGLLAGEGVETVLTAARAFTPAWAMLDAGNLAGLPVLPGIEALTVVADQDDAGRRAAEAVSARWTAAGREVRVWG